MNGRVAAWVVRRDGRWTAARKVLCAALCAGLAVATGCGMGGTAGDGEAGWHTAVVERGDIRVTVPFQGELSARRVAQVAVGVQGSAVVAELAAEGTKVEKGDVVARFDTSKIEQDLARQESECVRARQELESLEKAELPLEWLDLEAKQAEAAAETAAEERFLESVRELNQRGLMSEAEVERQARKVEGVREREKQAEQRAVLTKTHLHRARLAKARAAAEAAERQRDFTARQLALCEVRAPEGGTVTLVPLPVGGEYRTAHVGDTLFQNQVFLCVPDLSEYVIQGYAGEAELSGIQPGATVRAELTAFPGRELRGRVESVGGMAQTRPGQPVWRKYFPVQIGLDHDGGAALPVGLSARAEIEAGAAMDVWTLPRGAVAFRDGAFHAMRIRADGSMEDVVVDMGLADDSRVEIRGGLVGGDRVAWPR